MCADMLEYGACGKSRNIREYHISAHFLGYGYKNLYNSPIQKTSNRDYT